MIKKRNNTQEIILGTYVICYFIVNLFTLTDFPFVHSDESWLSGLTRNMMETGNFGVTETFYDLKPRYPHGIKILFHILQMPMLAIFKYHIFSFRLLSLIFGCFCLILFYFLLKSMLKNNGDSFWEYPLLGTILLSLDIHFIYANHFARQEIILVFCIIACIYALQRSHYLLAAVITGLSIGIHPNSFLIGTMCAVILFPLGVRAASYRNLHDWKPFLTYGAVTSAFAAAFIALSLSFDRGFFKHYLAYGNSEFEIGAPITNKLAELPYFIKKIWYGISGTYYVPDIRLELLLFAAAIVAASLYLLAGKQRNRKQIILILKGIFGLIIGMVIIGRYNQTSIVFLFPLFFILIILMIDSIFHLFTGRKDLKGYDVPIHEKSLYAYASIFVLIIVIAFSSYVNITPWLSYSYKDYLSEIEKVVSPHDKVLANLNSEYYFDNGKLLDYRNLSYLKEEGLTIEEYIKKNEIEYLILSDELDFIYSQRPVWNMIYGNLRYLEELHEYAKSNCTLVHSFQNNTYGVRMVQYMNSDRDFTIQIFKVKNLS